MIEQSRSLAAIMVLVFASSVRADILLPPYSYKIVAPGEKFVFVMISPVPVEKDGLGLNEEQVADIRQLRRTYTQSGMYRNDGTNLPVWTVEWYAYIVIPLSDGVHLIRPGPWAWLREDRTPNLDVEAVSFFHNGQLLRNYKVGELVDAPNTFPRSVSHYNWEEKGDFIGAFHYTVKTLDGNSFVFDVRTGEIVQASRVGKWSPWIRWVTLVVATGATSVWVYRRWLLGRQSPNRSHASPA